MSKPIITHPTYYDIEFACAKLCIRILKENVHIDRILGVSRGGLFPATTISELLDIQMIPVAYSSKWGKGDNKNHQNSLPEIFWDGMNLPRLLIVEDIADSGETLHEISSHYKKLGYPVYTSVLYFRKMTTSPIVPDFVWQELKEDDPWIVFPHER